MNKTHIGSDFNDFLRDEGILEEANAIAAKRVVAFRIVQEMQQQGITKSDLANRMHTSRSTVDRLLDPTNPAVTLSTLERAAAAVGKRLTLELA